MQLLKYCFSILIFTLLINCRPTVEVTSEYEPGFTLAEYKTFSFITEDTTNENKLVWRYLTEIGIIKDRLKENLQNRGLTYTETNPDLKINIGIVVEEQIQTRETNFMTDPPRYIGQRRYAWKVEEVEVGRYQQGTVTVHLIDNQENSLVWQGVAEAVIPSERRRMDRQINEGIQKMVNKMP